MTSTFDRPVRRWWENNARYAKRLAAYENAMAERKRERYAALAKLGPCTTDLGGPGNVMLGGRGGPVGPMPAPGPVGPRGMELRTRAGQLSPDDDLPRRTRREEDDSLNLGPAIASFADSPLFDSTPSCDVSPSFDSSCSISDTSSSSDSFSGGGGDFGGGGSSGDF